MAHANREPVTKVSQTTKHSTSGQREKKMQENLPVQWACYIPTPCVKCPPQASVKTHQTVMPHYIIQLHWDIIGLRLQSVVSSPNSKVNIDWSDGSVHKEANK